MTYNSAKKFGIYFITAGIIAVLASCGQATSPIEEMEKPVRLVRNDSITQVEDKSGRIYVLNVVERSDYAVALMSLGDTLTSEI